MTYDDLIQTYANDFVIKKDEPIARYTTLKIGGKADLLFISPRQLDQQIYEILANTTSFAQVQTLIPSITSPLVRLIHDLQENAIPYYLLGGGSDVLFSDNDFHGVVIKLASTNTTLLEKMTEISPITPQGPGSISRHQKVAATDGEASLDFSSLYFDEDHSNPVFLYADAGVSIPFLIQHTLGMRLSGLHWFTHIPASIGGAIFNNIHGGKIMFADYVHSVLLLAEDGTASLVSRNDMAFAYDYSRLHERREIVLGAILQVYRQDEAQIQLARNFSDKWIAQKFYVQPKHFSAGCAFKNLTDEQKKRAGVETNSTGYLIDKAGLRGFHIGDAKIYEQHGNFFLNVGNATGKDFKQLIDYATKTIQEKYGITLEPEIRIVNFEDQKE